MVQGHGWLLQESPLVQMLNLDALPSKAGECLAVRSNTTHTISRTVILSTLCK